LQKYKNSVSSQTIFVIFPIIPSLMDMPAEHQLKFSFAKPVCTRPVHIEVFQQAKQTCESCTNGYL